jgi:hypothetical protein
VKKRLLISMLIVVMTLSACRFATRLGGGGGQANKYQYIFKAPTNPIHLDLKLEQGSSLKAIIGPTGGQVSATGADGTVYTLDIPEKALTVATAITLTPITSVSGGPFDGKTSYAVQLEPEGLYLYEDAILTITPTKPIPLAQQLFFSYKGDGNTVGLAIPVVDSQELKIRLMHFSGYGVSAEISAEGNGNPTGGNAHDVYLSDSATIQGQLGGDVEAAIQSLAAEAIAKMRESQESSGNTTLDPQQVQTILDLMDQWDQEVIQPSLEGAGTSCAAGKEAMRKILGQERLRQMLGMGGSSTTMAQVVDLLKSGATKCIKEEYQRCVDQHVINGMIPLYVDQLRQYEIEKEGSEASIPEPENLVLARDLTTKCLTFELQFHSEGSFDTGDGGYKSIVDGKIPLHFDPSTFTIKGSGPLDNLSFEFTPPKGGSGMKCTAANTTGGSTFEVKELAYVEDTRSETDPEPYVRDFNMLYFPGVTSESYKIHCTLTDSQKHVTYQDYAAPPSGYWTGIFFTLHQDELNAGSVNSLAGGVPSIPDMAGLQAGALPAMPAPEMPADGGFFADSWTITPGDALMASKEWIKNDSAASITESGTLKLYHRPGE